jgi:hypothetical protein
MSVLSKHLYSKILPITIFGIAMGVMEAVIVVYLRELYFPNGFEFPMNIPDNPVILVAELAREVATIVMLLALAWAVTRSYLGRFAWFLFAFAVWDIIYYVGLKVFLDWPESLFTWDILFLIPVTWVGPVLVPVLCSVLMIILAFAFLKTEDLGEKVQKMDWTLIWMGAIVIFITFIQDFSMLIISEGLITDIFNLSESSNYKNLVSTYVPEYFNWPVFAIGFALIIVAVIRIFRYKR